MTYAINDLMAGNFPDMLKNLKSVIGIDGSGNFQLSLLTTNLTPIVVGALVHKGANMFGINKALRKVPWVQV
jgi:hypothetical protein